jgi:hypothetical protein
MRLACSSSSNDDALARGAETAAIAQFDLDPEQRKTVEDRPTTHGYEPTRKAVMAAFAKGWRRG